MTLPTKSAPQDKESDDARLMPPNQSGTDLPSSAARVFVVVIPILIAVALVYSWFRLLSPTDDSSVPLPVIANVPSFTLIERSGQQVTRDDLLGTVWVSDFIFTTCAGPCPQLSLRMRSLHKTLLEEFGQRVKCVSITVDPLHDQAPVLRKYASRYGADPQGWWFLTNEDEAAQHELVTAGFLQALSPAKGGSPIIHSTRFVLIDKQGRIRGWHDGLDPASKKKIIRDVKTLLAEPTSP